MLSFDIETEGLNKYSDRISVACVYDPEKNIKRSFNFLSRDEDTVKNSEDFLAELDRAESLCSFNGARFDLPFIIQRFNVPRERYTPWFLKLFDYFEVCKVYFGSSCSLNKLLEVNGEEVKTSSGMQAVVWAREEKWEELIEYCMADTVLTHKISSKQIVILPLTRLGNVVCNHRLPVFPSINDSTPTTTSNNVPRHELSFSV